MKNKILSALLFLTLNLLSVSAQNVNMAVDKEQDVQILLHEVLPNEDVPFEFTLTNNGNKPITIERMDNTGLIEFTNFNNISNANTILKYGDSLTVKGIFNSKGYTESVQREIKIKTIGTNREHLYIWFYAEILSLNEKISRSIRDYRKEYLTALAEEGKLTTEIINKEDILKIYVIIPDNSKIQKEIEKIINNCTSLEELNKINCTNATLKNVKNIKLVEIGTSIDKCKSIIEQHPELKPNLKERLLNFALSFRNCEDIIAFVPEFKNSFESKMASYVSNSNEYERFILYYPNSLNKSSLFQKLIKNPISFEDVMYVIRREPSTKLRLESKAFELLPKYASSTQCKEFITAYPNSTYKGMVEAQYHAALMDERVSKTMDDKLAEQQRAQLQAQPKDDRCNACGGRGVCLECNGRGTKVCDDHDSNGDGHCTTCDDKGYIVCSRCDGKGTCTSCNGRGRRN